MKQWLRQFMAGRYGVDQLSMAMAICSMVLMLVSRVFRLRLLYWIAAAMLAAMVFRSYSRNTAKRYQENQWFIGYFKQLRRWAAGLQNQWQERKAYRFFKCPSCGQKLRVPKGKGKICITCPKCKTELLRKT